MYFVFLGKNTHKAITNGILITFEELKKQKCQFPFKILESSKLYKNCIKCKSTMSKKKQNFSVACYHKYKNDLLLTGGF